MSQLQMLIASVGLCLLVVFAAAALSTPMPLPFLTHVAQNATIEPGAAPTLFVVMKTPPPTRPSPRLRKVLFFRLMHTAAANKPRHKATPIAFVVMPTLDEVAVATQPLVETLQLKSLHLQGVIPTAYPAPFSKRLPNPNPTLIAVATLTAPPVHASALAVPTTLPSAALPPGQLLAMANARKLDRRAPPGNNFDLSLWELQEPTGAPNSPITIATRELQTFQDAYFFTDRKDGAMDFWDPEDGAVSAHSRYPRSELREMTAAGTPANWPLTGTHTLSASLKVTQVPGRVCVGQIHVGTGTPASTKPLFELFYHEDGSIVAALEQTPKGGNTVTHAVGHVQLGQRWSYVIAVSDGALSIRVDDGDTQTWPVPPTFYHEKFFFKAGADGQSVGDSPTVGTRVSFYALEVTHGP